MKNKLISAALLTVAAGAANAQMAFETGEIDFSYYGYETIPDLSGLVLGVRGAYGIGQMGMQLDASAIVMTDWVDSLEMYSAGLHLYMPLANGSKIGAFAAFDIYGPSVEVYRVGAEGMANFGALDLEAAASYIAMSSDNYWAANIDAYYAISPAFEINAGAFFLNQTGFSFSTYTVGASYTLPTIPLAIGASYTATDTNGIYGLNASFAFGPKPQERLFKSRRYPLYQFF